MRHESVQAKGTQHTEEAQPHDPLPTWPQILDTGLCLRLAGSRGRMGASLQWPQGDTALGPCPPGALRETQHQGNPGHPPAQAWLLEQLNPGACLNLASGVHGPAKPEPREVVLCSLWLSSQASCPPPSQSLICTLTPEKEAKSWNSSRECEEKQSFQLGKPSQGKTTGPPSGLSQRISRPLHTWFPGVRSTELRVTKAKGANG